jgi:capsular exopolysaccharide synthesis family protein
MSRIADVLKRAEAERARASSAGEAAAGADPVEAAGSAVPWELQDGRGAHRDVRDGGLVPRAGGRGAAPMLQAAGGLARGAVPPPPDTPPLRRYAEVLGRRWRTGVLILLVVVGGVGAGAMLQEPVYRASGLLEIRRESTAAVPVDSLFSSEKVTSDDLETQYGILKSSTLAQRVLQQLGRGPGGGIDEATAAARVGGFREALVVNPLRGSRLVEVAYVSRDPQLAARTVNSVFDNYLQLRMEEAQRTAQWLEQQLLDAQGRLEASDRRLQAYIRQHGLQVIETGKGEAAQLANERLQALHDALAAAQAERMDKQSAGEAVRRAGALGGLDSPVAQNLTMRLADLRREHAKLTSVFHEEYPSVKALNDQIAELERALAEESRSVVVRTERDYQAAIRKEALLRRALDEQNAAVQDLGRRSGGGAGYEALRRELVTNQEQFAVLNEKLKEISVSAALKAQSVGVVDRARPPSRPDGTPLPLTLALTTIVGLVVAAGGALLREHFDTSVRTASDVEGYLGVRALGAIPAVRVEPLPPSAGPGRSWSRIDDRGTQQSPLAEAFATLRNAVLLHEGAAASRVLLITSAQSEEGKTTVSVNLALSLARLEYRVLLVDGNMRYPCIRRALGLPDGPGLVDCLDARADWRGAVHTAVQPNLDVLGGGEPETSPADLLSRPLLGDLLDAAAREYDFVVIDSPAVLTHPADVNSLAAVVDNVLFTVRHGWTPREVAALALSRLDRVSGVVLNRSVSPEFGPGHQGSARRISAPAS